MEFWRTKVIPRIRKVMERDGHRKAAAAEACKAFDDSKEEINKEFEERRAELASKVQETYEAASVEIKGMIKDPAEARIKKHSAAVNKFMEELVKIELPGSKQVSDASSKYGPVLVSGPVLFMLEKVASLVPTGAPQPMEASSPQEKDVVVEEERGEEVKMVPPMEAGVEPPVMVTEVVEMVGPKQ